MLMVTDLYGRSEPFTDFELTRNRRVNGEKVISFIVVHSDKNEHAYPLIQEESIITFGNDSYVVKKMTERTNGKKSTKKITGIHKFYVDLGNKQRYDEYTGSMTFNAALTRVFEGTGYTFSVIGSFSAQSFENFGKKSRLALLQQVLERYKAEISINGNLVTFREMVGNDTDFQFRYGFNIKTFEQSFDTTNLATYIEGTGAEGISATYTSPNAVIFDKLDAPKVEDERFKTKETLLEEMKARLQDTPEFSISLDFVDLRAAGYPYIVPNEGDRVFVIYEPMQNLNMETRMLEIEEVFDTNLNVVSTKVVLANHKKTFAKTMLGTVQKALKTIVDDGGKIKSTVLDDAIIRATEALTSAQTELEFSNGIIGRDKTDPNKLVLFTSAGIGVSTDGGQTFRTAMTGEGIVADLITVGTMSFDRLQGGTLTLGGYQNVNGVMHVFNSDGDLIADLDGDRGGFDTLMIGDVISDSVVKVNQQSYELFVNPVTGDDNSDGRSWATAFETVQRAINSIPKYNDGNITINVFIDGGNGVHMRESILFYGFVGNGEIILDFRSRNSTLDGWITVNGCSNAIRAKGVTIRGRSQTSMARAWGSNRVYFENVIMYGNNVAEHGFYCHTSTMELINCEVYELIGEKNCIRGAMGADIVVVDCKGLGDVGFRGTSGAQFSGHGTMPMGSVSKQILTSGAFTHSTHTEDAGSATPPKPLPPPETTNNWKSTEGRTYRLTQGYWDTQYALSTTVAQGRWDANTGHLQGLWFFGTGPRNVVNGKSIKRIRVRLGRENKGGYSEAINAIIRPHGYASRPGGAPSFLGASHSVGFKWGETKWVTLPSSFHSYFANGSAYGIGIYTTSTAQGNYMRFKPGAEIEITYN